MLGEGPGAECVVDVEEEECDKKREEDEGEEEDVEKG